MVDVLRTPEQNAFFNPNMQIRNIHIQKTKPPLAARRVKKEHGLYKDYLKNTDATINENKNPIGYCVRTVSGKTICNWCLNVACKRTQTFET